LSVPGILSRVVGVGHVRGLALEDGDHDEILGVVFGAEQIGIPKALDSGGAVSVPILEKRDDLLLTARERREACDCAIHGRFFCVDRWGPDSWGFY